LLDELLEDQTTTQILWFGARLRLYDDSPEIKYKSEKAVRIQSRFVNHIQQQRIQFIKVGYLRARENEPCEECGKQTWRLTEKGVDVGMAVRILSEANKDTELVIVSADTDLIPAFKAAHKLGAKLMHVGYEHRPIISLSSMADTTRIVTLPVAQKYAGTEQDASEQESLDLKE
jgi:uncharacterized LabA/DUF88 family protein